MYIKRSIEKELIKWKNAESHKPILLRGARQVGKTQVVRHFSQQFEHFLEINFESDKKIHSLFDGNFHTSEIIENLSAIYNIPVISKKTLLFFDEIQTCIPAIQSLRFFYEQIPDLHIIAAGSLLEFAIAEIPSFGVGRIRSMYMYPLSFQEFLAAFGEEKLIELKNSSSPQKPVTQAVHEKLTTYLRKFFIIGGMPEVVASFVEFSDYSKCQRIINDLLISLNDDFAKYKRLVPVVRIRDVFLSVVKQTGSKFMFSKTQSQDNHKQIKEALNLLILAGLVLPVTHSDANGLPLGAEANAKKQKMLIFDSGVYLKILNTNISELILSPDFNLVNRGELAELFVGLEFIKYQSLYEKSEIHYWHREAKNSNAEIDYLIVSGNSIIPVEVKSGTKGSMQSMHLFLKEKKSDKGIRLSLENFSQYDKIDVYPLYAIDLLFRN